MVGKHLTATVKREAQKTRRGRGFSRKELKSAGISLADALKTGLSVDTRRGSMHEENVQLLQEHLRKLREAKAALAQASKTAKEAKPSKAKKEKAEKKKPEKRKQKKKAE